jgi:hypothetical protein
VDRGAPDTKNLADQGCEVRHHPFGGAGEDRLHGAALVVVCTVVDVQGDLPVSVGHRPRRPRDQADVQPVQRDVADVAGAVLEVLAANPPVCLGRSRICRNHHGLPFDSRKKADDTPLDRSGQLGTGRSPPLAGRGYS